MEGSLLETLHTSMSALSLLASHASIQSVFIWKYHQIVDEIQNLLRPILDEKEFFTIGDEDLNKALQELDTFINEARKFLESWHQMSSKVFFVLQIESLIAKIQKSELQLCHTLLSLHQPVPFGSDLRCLEDCIHKLECFEYEPVSYAIESAIQEKINDSLLNSEVLQSIAASLSLESNEELLLESLSLEKLKDDCIENPREIEHVNHIMAVITYMHDQLVKEKQLQSINGVPIPTDFCCPLSLQLMSDPVIVASGQTYERAFIRKWLDQGITICPKTHQTLVHTNLIPNYTVKALIANFCESNNVKLPDPIKCNLRLSPVHSEYKGHSRSSESIGDVNFNDKNPSSSHTHSSTQGNSTGFVREDKEDNAQATLEKENLDPSASDEQYQSRIRNASTSSALSNPVGEALEISHVSSDPTHYSSDNLGEVKPVASTPPIQQRQPEFTSRSIDTRLRGSTAFYRRPSDQFIPRIVSTSTEMRPELSAVVIQVRNLMEDLQNSSIEVQRAAAAELRLLSKHSMDNRSVIAECGAVKFLVELLRSTDLKTQENAVTALLNLSINNGNKSIIANADAIDPLIHVLDTGSSEARENAAATLFSLSVNEENKARIGRSGAINSLVELLRNGTPRGKKDAATALFNLSLLHENKTRIVQAGAVPYLVELMDPAIGLVDKAVAVLSNLSTIPEGRVAIGDDEGGIPFLVEVVELGSSRGKENAAAALYQLCSNSVKFCRQVLQEGAGPPLVALLQSGTPRAKEKAQALLSHFKTQRSGNTVRG